MWSQGQNVSKHKTLRNAVLLYGLSDLHEKMMKSEIFFGLVLFPALDPIHDQNRKQAASEVKTMVLIQ